MSVTLQERPAPQQPLREELPKRLIPPALRLCAAALGLLGANAPMLGGLRPLGLCFAAAVPAPYALYTAAGAAVGYAAALRLTGSAPYLAAAAAAALLRGLSRAWRADAPPASCAAATGLVFCLVRSGLAVMTQGSLGGVFAAAAEALLMMGLCWLLAGFCAAAPQAGFPRDAEETAALCLAWMSLLVCLAPYAPLGLSLAHMAAAFAVLAEAGRGRFGPAAVLSAAAMAALCAARPDSLYVGLATAAGGLTAALFAGQPRPMTALVFCGAGLCGAFCAPDPEDGVRLAVTLCCAAAAYCLLPAAWLARLPAASLPGPAQAQAEPPRTAPVPNRTTAHTLSGRLEAVSGALCAVGDTMRAVCARMPPQHEGVSALCDAVAERCCADCEKRLACWVDGANETYDAFNQMAPLLGTADGVTPETLPGVLRGRCQTPLRLANAVNVAAAGQAARRACRVKNSAARMALCEQYSAMAAALTELAGQVCRGDAPDARRARRLGQLFSELALEPLEVSASVDEAGRLTALVCLPRLSLSAQELRALTQEVSATLRRGFAPAECTQAGAVTRLVFRETPRFAVECGVCALPASGGVCADAARTFTDAAGRFHAVLCDGMGTGKLAAVGGVLAASLSQELLRAGVESDSAARLVNIALSLKGDDEHAVTLDVLTVDLYTGDASLYKAGAAASFVLRSGSAAVYSSDTLPIGILGKVSGRRETLYLAPGDTAVLVSDGALAPGPAWLRAQLAAYADRPPRALAEAVAHAAWEKQRAAPDDVTVLALRLREAQPPVFH